VHWSLRSDIKKEKTSWLSQTATPIEVFFLFKTNWATSKKISASSSALNWGQRSKWLKREMSKNWIVGYPNGYSKYI